MREYGWDYYKYLNQPTWVIDLAREKLKIEAIRANSNLPVQQ